MLSLVGITFIKADILTNMLMQHTAVHYFFNFQALNRR